MCYGEPRVASIDDASLPMPIAQPDDATLPMAFAIAMGVRQPDVNRPLDDLQPQIRDILVADRVRSRP